MLGLFLGFGLGYFVFTEKGKTIVDAGSRQGTKMVEEIKNYFSKPDEETTMQEKF